MQPRSVIGIALALVVASVIALACSNNEPDTVASSEPVASPPSTAGAAAPTAGPAVSPSARPTASPTPAPTAAPTPTPTPSPTPAPRRVGEPATLTGGGGVNLTVTVNAVVDPAQSSNQFNRSQGRWVLIDWTITNNGSQPYDAGSLSFKLQSADGFLYARGNHAGHREPDLDSATLGPGQTVRGFLIYDVPVGQTLKAAIYQPSGSPQLVIAELTE